MRTANTTTNTLSSAGERSLQGFSQLVRFSVPDSMLNERSLPAQTVKIPLEYAEERNRLEYLKGLQSFKRKEGTINDGPFMLNYLNRKRNVDRMRERILEEIEEKIAEDKYYVLDNNVRELPRRQLRSNSVLLPNRKRNVLDYDPIVEDPNENDRVTSNHTRRKSLLNSRQEVSSRGSQFQSQRNSVASSKHTNLTQKEPSDDDSQDDVRKKSRIHKPLTQDSRNNRLLPDRVSERSQNKRLQPISQREEPRISEKPSERVNEANRDSSEDEW